MGIIILYSLLALLLLYSIFYIDQFINMVFKGNAPLIATKQKTINSIIDEIQIKEESVVYELGCGEAYFLKAVEKKFPQAKLIGVENLLAASFIFKIELWLRGSKIKIIRKDFFQVNLSDADVIYCFLFIKTMEKLGEKFKQECKKGTQIISHKFPLAGFGPMKVTGGKGERVYYYKV